MTLSRVELHRTTKLSNLYQRWDKQLLLIMYDEANQANNVVEPVRATRQSLKLNLRQYKLHNKKYINSPYIRGKTIWDKLPREIQYLDNKFEFKDKIRLPYSVYDDKYLDV